MRISGIDLSRLSNDKHFQFCTDTIRSVEKFGADTLKIAAQFNEFKSLRQKEDDTMKKITKSEYTALIQSADRARDNAYISMTEINSAYLRHHNPETQKAANRLKILFDTYGNVAKQSLLEQTSATHNILQELQGKYKSDTITVKIDEWILQLAVCNKEISELMNTRIDESAAKNTTVLRDLRKDVDAAYKTIAERINALAILDNSPAVEQFIKTMNAVITKYGGSRAATAHSTVGAGSARPQTDANIKPWNAGEDYNQMKIGDRRRTADGRIWEAIDLGQVHRDPCGDFGHFGWKQINA